MSDMLGQLIEKMKKVVAAAEKISFGNVSSQSIEIIFPDGHQTFGSNDPRGLALMHSFLCALTVETGFDFSVVQCADDETRDRLIRTFASCAMLAVRPDDVVPGR